MTYRHQHLLEKVQVQLAAVAAVALVYFALWPLLRPSDPFDPLVLLLAGGAGSTVAFALTLWMLSALCAVITISARPEGGLMAAVLGAGGASLHSAQIRGLLWSWEGRLSGLYPAMIGELLMLAAMLLAAALIVDLVRRGIASIRPGWLHKHAREHEPDLPAPATPRRTLTGFLGLLREGGRKRRSADRGRTALRMLGCLGLGLVASCAVLLLLLRSPDRGQILFAVVAAFLLGGLAAHQTLPVRHSFVVWAVPILAGVGFYLLAGVTAPADATRWSELPYYARILPIDWLTAGCGGSLVGYWSSERINDIRHIERKQQEAAAAG